MIRDSILGISPEKESAAWPTLFPGILYNTCIIISLDRIDNLQAYCKVVNSLGVFRMLTYSCIERRSDD